MHMFISFLQVRGVGAGGIVSTAFCLLYKLYTLRLTRKQVNGLMSHTGKRNYFQINLSQDLYLITFSVFRFSVHSGLRLHVRPFYTATR